jgi:hypothetical protein
MPNNAWWTTTINVSDAARAPSRHFFYRLEISQPVTPVGLNRLMLRSNAYLIAGQADLVNTSLPLVGGPGTMNDVLLINPQYVSINNAGPSSYSGEWNLYFYLPNGSTTLEFWDGDFDHGKTSAVAGYR